MAKSNVEKATPKALEDFLSLGLHAIEPFWMGFPFVDVDTLFTPDILHQLHKGIFKDYTVAWATSCLDGGAAELDW